MMGGMIPYQEDPYGYNAHAHHGGHHGHGQIPGLGGGNPYKPNWTNPFPNQQPAGVESAYQRLPVNNRRRNVHRDRPSDYYEVAGGQSNGYWE